MDPSRNPEDAARLAAALAELASAKARVERDAGRVYEETRKHLVAELLPILDNLDRAVASAAEQGDSANLVAGVRMVQRQLEAVLVGYGLVRFDAVGADFDPAIHDATCLVAVDDPARDRRVIDQLEPGYRFGERLLRAAKVTVGRHAKRANA